MMLGHHVGLRAIEPSDLPQLLLWRNQPELRQLFREYRELSSVHQQAWFDKVVMGDERTRMFAIVDRKSGALLGACGLCYIDWVNRSADFSIYLGADNLYIDDALGDEGLAVDAARVMLTYGKNELGLHRFWAEIYDFDTPKQTFFDTLGFQLDGRHRETHWTRGRWCDSLFYSLMAREVEPLVLVSDAFTDHTLGAAHLVGATP